MRGIYCIENTKTGTQYIGQTSRGFGTRWQQHISLLGLGKHHNYALQQDWDEHGAYAFVFRILERVEDISSLDVNERIWIERAESPYNTSPVARPARESPANVILWHRLNREHSIRTGEINPHYPSIKTRRTGRSFIHDGRIYVVPVDFYPYPAEREASTA